MSAVNLKFIYANVLQAAKLQIPINVIFSEGLATAIEAWEPTLRMEALASVIALINTVATTLDFSYVARSSDVRCHIPLNIYNIVVARSCMNMLIFYADTSFCFIYLAYGKSDIAKLVRHVLRSIRIANGKADDLCVDEFTRAGLMNSLDKATKMFLTDEADISFVDAGLFSAFAKPSPEANCRCEFPFFVE